MSRYQNLIEKAKQAYSNEELENAAMLYEEAFLEEVRLDDLMHLGAIYIDLKKYNKAIQIFKDLISIQDDNFLAYYGLASCYNDIGRFEDAINAFKQAIAVKPDYADAYFGLALMLDYKEDRSCEEFYLNTLKYEPNHYWANVNLGSHYEKKGEFDLSLKYALKAYEIDPLGDFAAYNIGAVYATLKNYDKAIEFYKKEIAKESPYIGAYLNIGILYKDIYKNYNNALIYYLEGIAREKDNVELWYNLGCLYVLMNDEDNAFNCLLYANLKDLKLREYMQTDSELEEFRKTKTYEKLINTIKG